VSCREVSTHPAPFTARRASSCAYGVRRPCAEFAPCSANVTMEVWGIEVGPVYGVRRAEASNPWRRNEEVCWEG
jgi:hypothetical protein